MSPRSGNTVFLGAGFSKWCCDLPLVSQLFDFDVHADNHREAARIERLRFLHKQWLANSDSNNAELFIETMQEHADDAMLTSWYITRRLTEPFVRRSSRRFTWYINSHLASDDPGIKLAKEFLRHATALPNSAVLTTNYDMIVEYALSSRGFNYGIPNERIGYSPYPYPRPVHASGTLPLLKLHGSLSWSENAKFPDLRCGLNGECVIVPPRASKRPREYFPKQWESAQQILQETKKTVFFGFAFNEYDVDVWDLLSSNLAGSESILLIDVVDHRPRIAQRFDVKSLDFLDSREDFCPSQVFRYLFGE